jgi:transcriptional regulator with XRE-family HTH domain
MKSKTEPLTLGEKLRKLRKEKGYSQEYFAECLKLSQKKYLIWKMIKILFR